MKSVKAVASYVKDIFKVEMELSDTIRLCSEALKLLKVFAMGNYVVVDTIDEYKIHLPNVYSIKSVVRLDAPISPIHIEVQEIVHPPQIFFEVPELTTSTEPASFQLNYINQLKGPYIDFVWDCPCLSFNETNIQVAIAVTSVKKDEEGYPMIPEAAFYACCYYCLYVHQLPLMLLNKVNPNAFAMVKQIKDQKFGQARADMVIESLNQNEIDKLGNIMTSMDRKAFQIGM